MIKIKKLYKIFVCLFFLSLFVISANQITYAAEYDDYYINGGEIVSNESGVHYQITKSDNTTSVKWTRRFTTAGAVGIQRYTVLVQDNVTSSYKLHAINKYTGNDRWTMNLSQSYERLQFIGGKYAVLMNQEGFIEVDLYSQKIVTGKTYENPADEYYGLIKSKKNLNYYVMTITDFVFKFYRLNVETTKPNLTLETEGYYMPNYDLLVYYITVTNTSNKASSPFLVIDKAISQTTYKFSYLMLNGGSWIKNDPSYSSGTGQWSISSVDANNSVRLAIYLTPEEKGVNYTNTATCSSTTNYSVSATVYVPE